MVDVEHDRGDVWVRLIEPTMIQDYTLMIFITLDDDNSLLIWGDGSVSVTDDIRRTHGDRKWERI